MQREIDKFLLRSSIIDEERLERDVREHQRLRREEPHTWEQVEAQRRRRNEELEPLNARRRSLGLDLQHSNSNPRTFDPRTRFCRELSWQNLRTANGPQADVGGAERSDRRTVLKQGLSLGA